jgi:hypothetical protein
MDANARGTAGFSILDVPATPMAPNPQPSPSTVEAARGRKPEWRFHKTIFRAECDENTEGSKTRGSSPMGTH